MIILLVHVIVLSMNRIDRKRPAKGHIVRECNVDLKLILCLEKEDLNRLNKWQEGVNCSGK